MSHQYVCRFCVNTCRIYKNLYDKNGHGNGMYQIAIKYFPMILNVDQGRHLRVMCLECWRNISNFHNFRQLVLHSQAKLFDNINHADVNVASQEENKLNEGNDCDTPDVIYYDIFVVDDESVIPPTTEGDVVNTVVECPQEDEVSDHEATVEFVDSDNNILMQQNDIVSSEDICTDSYFNDDHEEMYASSQSNLESVNGQFSSSVEGDGDGKSQNSTNNIPQLEYYQSESLINDSNAKNVRDSSCKRPVSRKTAAELDRIISQWRPVLKCQFCDAVFLRFKFLQQHIRLDHPTEECFIECCNYKFKCRKDIVRHVRRHNTPSNMFDCKLCGKSVKGRRALQYHIERKHSNKYRPATDVCSDTSERYISRIDDLIAQWKQRVECGICSEPHTSYDQLRTHFRQNHPHEECHIICCQQKLNKKYLIEDHILLHIDPDCFVCKTCNLRFALRHSLKRHMFSKHQIL